MSGVPWTLLERWAVFAFGSVTERLRLTPVEKMELSRSCNLWFVRFVLSSVSTLEA